MIWIWFGLDGTGIEESPGFHWLLGPSLMVLFAFLGNTLFLTILVSMLSNTFSMIVRNAVQEIQYRRTVLTFEGVKSDAIFAYPPPFNILALVILLPLKKVLSQRMFHKVHVACVKTINMPILLVIAWYERHTLWRPERHRHFTPRRIDWTNPWGPRAAGKGWWSKTMSFWDFSKFSVHGDLQAVFEISPPDDLLDLEYDNEESNRDHRHSNIGQTLRADFANQFRSRRDTVKPEVRNRRPSALTRQRSSRRESTFPQPISRSASNLKDDKLRSEFADSESGEDGGDEQGKSHPKGHRKIKKGARLDSLVDFSEGDSMQEANARLHQMESSLERLENMVRTLIEGADSGGSESAENELRNATQTGTFE
jgi:hypothetical protein